MHSLSSIIRLSLLTLILTAALADATIKQSSWGALKAQAVTNASHDRQLAAPQTDDTAPALPEFSDKKTQKEKGVSSSPWTQDRMTGTAMNMAQSLESLSAPANPTATSANSSDAEAGDTRPGQ